MKNKDVLTLVNSGCLSATYHTLSDDGAYNVYKFKKVVKSLLTSFLTEKVSIGRKLDIPDIATFLKTTKSGEKLVQVSELLKKLSNADVPEDAFKDVSLLSYSEWRKLQEENKSTSIAFVDKTGATRSIVQDVFTGRTEELLEGVLWAAPVKSKTK